MAWERFIFPSPTGPCYGKHHLENFSYVCYSKPEVSVSSSSEDFLCLVSRLISEVENSPLLSGQTWWEDFKVSVFTGCPDIPVLCDSTWDGVEVEWGGGWRAGQWRHSCLSHPWARPPSLLWAKWAHKAERINQKEVHQPWCWFVVSLKQSIKSIDTGAI